MIAIVATDSQFGIGREGSIPWDGTPFGNEDYVYFRNQTFRKHVVMGRKTWESLPTKPLSHRHNIIVTSTPAEQSMKYAACISKASACGWYVTFTDKPSYSSGDWVIGGASVYKTAIATGLLHKLYLTFIVKDYKCDTHFPINDLIATYSTRLESFERSESRSTEHGSSGESVVVYKMIIALDRLRIESYPSVSSDEMRYLMFMRDIMLSGSERQTRNAVTRSVFGGTLEFDLSRFPLLTTKTMPLYAIFEELMFFIRGHTDANLLAARGVHIWDHNTSEQFLRERGLNYAPGQMGPMYGYNWRHFPPKTSSWRSPPKTSSWRSPHRESPAARSSREEFAALPESDTSNAHAMNAASSSRDDRAAGDSRWGERQDEVLGGEVLGDGFDQLARCIGLISQKSTDRSIMMTTFNPATAHECVLYPCHGIVTQFYIDKNRLSCSMYQRSADMFLGVPFNIASYALLVYIICSFVNAKQGWEGADRLVPGRLIINFGDAHIYTPHISAVCRQLLRAPGYPLPTLKIITDHDRIEDYAFEDLLLEGYQSYPRINAELF